MKTGQAGLALIKKHEGCRLVAYLDATGTPTIGWGHTGNVSLGNTVTQAQADALLVQDLAECEQTINDSGVTLNQNQFDAMVSLLYNCGTGVFHNFTALIQAKNWQGVTLKMSKYTISKGLQLTELVNRRAEEIDLFNTKNTMQTIDYVILTLWLILGALIAYKIFN